MMPGELRIGCDLCQIATIEQMLEEDHGTIERLFRVEEREYARAHAQPAQHLAGVFAAKEALAKAARKPGLLGKYHGDVVVTHLEDGAPSLDFSEQLGGALARAGIRVLDVSISHDGEYAVAAVLIQVGQAGSEATADAKAGRPACQKCLLPLEHLRAQGITDVLIQTADGSGAPAYLCPVCLRGW